MRKTIIVLLFSLALPVQADTLSLVRATLGRLGAKAPIEGTVEVQTTRQSKEDDDKKDEQGRASLDFELTPAGLNFRYAPALIEKSRQEQRANDANPETSTPTRSAFGEIDALDVVTLLDSGDRLQRELEHAKVAGDTVATVDGKPARRLVLTLDPRLSKREKKRVKTAEYKLVLWTTPEGVPLRADYTLYIKASFLVVSFEQRQNESLIFTTHDDHLVALRRESHSSGSGMGQQFATTTVTTIALK